MSHDWQAENKRLREHIKELSTDAQRYESQIESLHRQKYELEAALNKLRTVASGREARMIAKAALE